MAALGMLACLALTGCPTDDPQPEANATTENKGNMPDNSTQGCMSECLLGDSLCKNEFYILECELQPDGCRKYSKNARRCNTGEICNARTNKCEVESGGGTECVSNCVPSDAPRCNSNGEVETCALRDGEDCFTYEVSTTCEAGEVCNAGACGAPACSGAPCTLNDTVCEGDQVRVCQMINGCAVFAPAQDCKEGQVCQGTNCEQTTSCEDLCITGQDNICTPTGAPRLCQTLASGCTGYVDMDVCMGNTTCEKGACVEADDCPVDACKVGEKTCLGEKVEICEIRQDGCPGREVLEDCGANGFLCDASQGPAQCSPPAMMSSAVVINEILYNIPGPDVDATTMEAKSFIELRGQPGKDLSGWEVRLVNGSNGMPYETLTLPQGSSIGSSGYVLIVTDKPVRYLDLLVFAGTPVFALIPTSSTSDGIQNGPDNVELYDAMGMKMDALGYGEFGANDIFTGEGSSPGRVYENRSLGRINGAADTNDNSADFVSLFPTPGQANGDLIINEVYVDQPGADGQADTIETFIELLAPVTDAQWIDMELDQYNLRAVNGMDGMDYIFSGPNPGIDFSGARLQDVMRATGEVGSEGYVLICNIDSTPAVLNRCSVAYEGVDFQDGPDSIVLEYQGRVIDSIAYGSFGASDTKVGEGTPASFTSTDAGKSMNRTPDATRPLDTNNNSADFHLASPSPGAKNANP